MAQYSDYTSADGAQETMRVSPACDASMEAQDRRWAFWSPGRSDYRCCASCSRSSGESAEPRTRTRRALDREVEEAGGERQRGVKQKGWIQPPLRGVTCVIACCNDCPCCARAFYDSILIGLQSTRRDGARKGMRMGENWEGVGDVVRRRAQTYRHRVSFVLRIIQFRKLRAPKPSDASENAKQFRGKGRGQGSEGRAKVEVSGGSRN